MRRQIHLIVVVFLISVAGIGCNSSNSSTNSVTPVSEDVIYTQEREKCGDADKYRNLYFGDLHTHTQLSFDAYSYEVRTTTAQAYEFARGKEIMLAPLDSEGNGTRPAKISRPLDFVAMTDHQEYIAEIPLCTVPGTPAYDTKFCQDYRVGGEDVVVTFGLQITNVPPVRFGEICDTPGVDCYETAKAVWASIVQDAEDADDKTSDCSFTAFPSYEYTTSYPNIANNHRNVIFRNADVPELPPSFFERPTEQGLWKELKETCLDQDNNCDTFVIPHNSNWSNGNMFVPDYMDLSIDEQVEAASLRIQMEPLIELHQHKGDMEAKNGFPGVPYDPLADFEKIREADFVDCGVSTGAMGVAGSGCVSRYDFFRNILKLGISEQHRLGVNPYKLGVIAGTDSHNGNPGNTEEYNFKGCMGNADDTPQKRLGPKIKTHNFRVYNPGGLTGVWSVENSRDALFEAFRRRETYSTSGTRISVRLFGGWDYPSTLCEDPDFVPTGYDKGVPMGGTLTALQNNNASPVFAVTATKDPGVEGHPGTDLQLIQIIKGWIDADGEEQEKIYDVAGDANNGASVDMSTCEISGEGWETLCAVWTDPDFDPAISAFYYARVVENPTCSWRQYDCNEFSADDPERPDNCDAADLNMEIQERAVTSPIWYDPLQ